MLKLMLQEHLKHTEHFLCLLIFFNLSFILSAFSHISILFFTCSYYMILLSDLSTPVSSAVLFNHDSSMFTE
jgi:hypothetical protein